ncbi:MAG: SGNH/GDSL hydrolase family protein, partial [Nitrospinota bacterium]
VHGFKVNDSGASVSFRNEEIPFKKKDEQRILFLGDSGTIGWGVDFNQSFPLQLKKRLDEEYPEHNYKVMNGGVYGFNTYDAFKLLTEKLFVVNPDSIVLGFFMANDINFNLKSSPYLFYLPKPVTSLSKWLKKKSSLYHALGLRLLALNNRYKFSVVHDLKHPPFFLSSINLMEPGGLHMLNYQQGEIAGYKKEYSVLMEHAFSLTEEVLSKFKKFCLERDIDFKVLLIPATAAIAGKYISLVDPDILKKLNELQISIQDETLDVLKPTRKILEICKRIQIHCINPTQEMQKRGLITTIPGDDHPSVEGHRILASSLYEFFIPKK